MSQEVLFRCLDRDGSGAIMEKDFAAFQDYDQEKWPGYGLRSMGL